MGYGMKSRLWWVMNPIAKIVEDTDPGIFWKYDLGRTVRTETNAIPLFQFALDAFEGCRDGVTIHGMMGTGIREGVR